MSGSPGTYLDFSWPPVILVVVDHLVLKVLPGLGLVTGSVVRIKEFLDLVANLGKANNLSFGNRSFTDKFGKQLIIFLNHPFFEGPPPARRWTAGAYGLMDMIKGAGDQPITTVLEAAVKIATPILEGWPMEGYREALEKSDLSIGHKIGKHNKNKENQRQPQEK